MAKAYTTSNPVVRDNGATHSHVCDVERVEMTIPEDAEQRPGADGDYWNWIFELANGGRINLQAYGPQAQPGATATFDVEVREKKLPKNKGGFAFVYVKCKPANLPANAQLVVTDGATLRQVDDIANPAVTTIWCPQQKHDGGIIFAPLDIDLMAEADEPLAEVIKSAKRVVRRTRKTTT
jgi:hypothetical protein